MGATFKVARSAFHDGGAALIDHEMWEYTVPSGRKATVENMFALVANNSVTALNEAVVMAFFYRPNGAADALLGGPHIALGRASASERHSQGLSGIMQAGDRLRAVFLGSNTAAGTSVSGSAALLVTESDA